MSAHLRSSDDRRALEDDALWFKDAVVYEVHVRAFFDSSEDGIGDFPGLTERLDYLQELGVTALWILPFYPSPVRDDGYDIADFRSVHPAYGTIRQFRAFLREAHRRGLRVITELVLNHTSDQHPWFQRARRAPFGSRWHDFYVWSDTPDRYSDARIIFPDFELSNWSWDPVARAYYWHRFYSHQPDLNYESPDVRRAILRTVSFWLGLGVDGLRLDAVPYLYEREDTTSENLQETHAFLRMLRRYVDERFENRMLLAEANQWPEDAAEYFGGGEEAHMAFHFPLMPRLFMAIRMEDRFPIVDILQQTPEIPLGAQWAVFLRNHDELTLEMVTDEERDYMYRVYAYDAQARVNLGIRRRLAPLLGNDRRKIELMNCLLLSLPGTPVIYYGDEIGMGDNIFLGDRDGVRTPMQWNSDRNAGFSRANSQRLYLPVIIDPEFHYETVNVEAQQRNSQSLLWWMRRMIALRRRFRVFGRGSFEPLYPDNPKVLAFVRRYEDQCVLVVANLSRLSQYVELDLSEFKGTEPLELLGQTSFPAIGDLSYLLTLGPYAFYWFALEAPRAELAEAREAEAPAITVGERWDGVFARRPRRALEGALRAFISRRRWFAGKARTIQSLAIRDVVPLAGPRTDTVDALTLLDVEYTDGEPETYVMPLALAKGERAERISADVPQAVVAQVVRHGERALIYDGVYDPDFGRALLDAVARRRRLRSGTGVLAGRPTRVLRGVLSDPDAPLEPSISGAEQSNTSITYGGRLILKLFRRVERGVNPDLEVGLFLGERGFEHVPPVAGSIEYRESRGEPLTFAVLHEIVPNQGDAWSYTLGELGRIYEQILAEGGSAAEMPELPRGSLLELAEQPLPALARETSTAYVETAELLGQRTAELHNTLASAGDRPEFRPEPITRLHQRSLYQSMRTLVRRNLQLLRRSLPRLSETERAAAHGVLEAEGKILDRLRLLVTMEPLGLRTRLHGDLHLGQLLFTGRDFVIIDFEGEPARALSERKLKRTPLRDVAGMLRSFDYATHAGLRDLVARGLVAPDSAASRLLGLWGRRWYTWAAASFLRAYLETASGHGYLPDRRESVETLLDAHLLEKAVYEIGYELNSRPDWVGISLAGVLDLLDGA